MNDRRWRCLLPLATTTLLAGCATGYVSPTAGPTASLQIQYDGTGSFNLWTFENPGTCSGPVQRLAQHWIPDNGLDVLSFTVRANQPFIASSSIDLGIRRVGYNPEGVGIFTATTRETASCDGNIALDPIAGDRYVIQAMAEGRWCSIAVFRKLENGGLEPARYRINGLERDCRNAQCRQKKCVEMPDP